MENNNDNKVLNVPHLRFPEFSEEWEICKVSELLDFYSTNSLSWEQLEYGTKAMMNLHYGLIHVGLPTMVDLTRDNLPNIKEDNMPKNFELCKEGDVAFADASEDTNEVAKPIEFFDLAGKNIVCGLHTIHGRDNKNKTVIGFKGYAFSSSAFHNQIRRIAQGTKIYSISTKNFSECFIGIPSKVEQTKIATLLRLIDERIATQNKIIDKLQSLIKGIVYQAKIDGVRQNTWQKKELRKVLQERNEKNTKGYEVCSVSVTQGVVNQIEYLGRSFAAKDTLHYNVVKYGDIVYTKSPTGDFPYGIVKRSNIRYNVAVSPLYGVYEPVNDNIGIILHFYFMQPSNALNYLHRLIQKGAKNTISITNGRFLENTIPLPNSSEETKRLAWLLTAIQNKMVLELDLLSNYQKQKQYLLRQMFI
ncbi:restriction endonuclease subunit S [Bacteroides xylanisolvens]|nr:restriction endonuclease subunit S [Bacteroides xylanisolvens]KAB6365479.1 restriction endonuclease subunit S [Bacteroides xylanisolvens]KAB6401095.1 restriction endonuclease subunit S [Bacteroides xylanisolvens]